MGLVLGKLLLKITFLSLLLHITTQCTNQSASVQKQFPGMCGKDIGVGENTSVWVISCSKADDSGNFYIFAWNGSKWNMIAGFGNNIAVEPNGTPWITNSGGQIYKGNGNNGWQGVSGKCAKDIAVGENSSVWILGCTPTKAGGFPIYSLNGSQWDLVPGTAERIAVEPNGNPWIIDRDGKIFKRIANSWQQVSGCAKDIGVGRNNSVWILGCTSVSNRGFPIYSWNGSKWNQIPGAASRIAVEPSGNPWAISIEEKIFRL
jgi:Tectonin domain